MQIAELLRSLRDRRVVVMGLGLHGGGVATTRWLLRHGARVLVTDLRSRAVLRPSLGQLGSSRRLSFVLGRHRHDDFRRADLIVANPGVPASSPFLVTARRAGIPIVNEATIFFALAKGRLIGVTGTKGKSTVSALIAHVLKPRYPTVVLAGNIRAAAMLAVLDRLTPRSVTVLELSSWQLAGLAVLKKSPHSAVVTNLLDDHLNQYASKAAYFRDKDLIWQNQTKRDLVVLNRDNLPSRARGRLVPSRRFWVSLTHFPEENGAFVRSRSFWFRKNGVSTWVAATTDLGPPGDHNVMNALAAVVIAREYRVPVSVIKRRLTSFRGVAGRLEAVRTWRGITFINDTTATAPSATVAALTAIKQPVILIAGGVDKQLPYADMARAIRRRAKALILLPGTATDKIRRSLGSYRPIRNAATMRQAVRAAVSAAEAGDTVLLSPGAASFNLFLHEFDRGDAFVRVVRSLKD